MTFAATIALSSLDGTMGFRLDGVAASDLSGFSVSNAGDVNGDGIGDLIVGASGADPNGFNSGSSYVVFGSRTGFSAAINLSSLDGTTGFRLDGAVANDQSGISVSIAGDVNGDGIGDLIVGAWGADPNGSGSGSSYVVFGSRAGFSAAINLSSLDGTTGFRLDGVAASDVSGRSVSNAGDVNGDGVGDLIVGAWGADPNGSNSGSSYVVFGSRAGFSAAINLSSLDGTTGFRLDGAAAGDTSGRSVSNAGDVNGDGFGDLIVGAASADPNGSNSGSSYVVFGRASFADTSTIALSALDGTTGFRLDGAAANNRNGFSVSAAGDVNGDGFSDLLVGAPYASPTGSSYVVYGRAPTEAVTRTGTEARNRIQGGAQNDTLDGLGGNDILYGNGGADGLDGGNGNDRLTGGTGADTMLGGAGNDQFWLATGDFAAGESIDGGDDTDRVVLQGATTVDLSLGTLSGIEAVLGSAEADDVTLSLAQLVEATVDLRAGIDALNVTLGGGAVDLGAGVVLRVRGVETGNLVGTDDADFVTLSGRQLDTILIGLGGIDLGEGPDTLSLTSASADLAVLSGADNLIVGLETISFAGAARGIALDLSAQSEDFELTGSTRNDSLTGGSGGDTITGGDGADRLIGGAGADTMLGGAGNDWFRLDDGDFAAGESISGGDGTDTIELRSNLVVNLSVGTLLAVERLTVEEVGEQERVTLSAPQWSGLAAIDFGASDFDMMDVVASGDISAGGRPSVAGVETASLVGTEGDDSLVLRGNQLDAILIGLGKIELGNGADTLSLISASSDLEGLAGADNSITGLETISFAGAARGIALDLSAQSEGFELTGSTRNDSLTGGAGDDTITGGDGNDILTGGEGADILNGGDGADRLIGGAGADTILGGAGNDWFRLDDGDFAAGESISGGDGTDRIELQDGISVNLDAGTLSGVERLTVDVDSRLAEHVTLSALQWSGLAAIDLGAADFDSISVVASGDISAGGRPSVVGVETGNLIGTEGGDSLVLRGDQLDAILIGSGLIDFGNGADTLSLTSASADLAALVAGGGGLLGLETISFAEASRGIVFDLGPIAVGGFNLFGSLMSDRLLGSGGADTIGGNAGRDRLTGGEGSDSFVLENTLASYDIVNDFVSGTDLLRIDATLFGGGLAEGALVADRFVASANPLALVSESSDGRFLFDNAGSGAGRVYWDVNGGAASDAVLVAGLTGVTNLAASDFLIV